MSIKKTQHNRHGENQIIALNSAPNLDGFEEQKANARGELIVGHSETGATHVVVSDKAKLYRKRGAEVAYLCLGEPTELLHRGDRHKPGPLKAGWHAVVVKRQANEDEGWSPVQD